MSRFKTDHKFIQYIVTESANANYQITSNNKKCVSSELNNNGAGWWKKRNTYSNEQETQVHCKRKLPGKDNKQSVNRETQWEQSKQPSAFLKLNWEFVVIERSQMEGQI